MPRAALRNGRPEKFTRDLVREVLYDQVYGVDIEETAIEIAAFSLCLTAFELDPTPNSRHQLKFKEQLSGRNLFVADAFDLEATFNSAPPFGDKQFDLVVGNPPWTRPKGKRSRSPSGKARYLEYCRTRKPEPIALPFRDPPDQAFVWRARDFAQPDARIGMVLEGKRFFSQEVESLTSKRALLTSFEPALLVNFAALHNLGLFAAAEQPAIVLVAVNRKARERAVFPYASAEFAKTFRRHGILQIGPERVHRLSVSLAASNPFALKIATWGSARDRVLVDRLMKEHDPIAKLLKKVGTTMRQGYIEGNREQPVPEVLHDLRCLAGGRMPPFEVAVESLPPFTERFLERPRDAATYRGPLLLCASGLRGNRIVAAYCHDDVVFSLSQFGASFKDGPISMALYLNAVLNSSLGTYLTFLTATKWGIEKYEVLPNDILRIPVPDPAAIEPRLMASILEVEAELRKTARAEAYDDTRVARLDELVFDLYDLEPFERVIVEDMVNTTIDFQRTHEASNAVGPASVPDCLAYAEHLMAVIQPFFDTLKKRRIVSEVIDVDVDAPLRVVRFQIIPWTSNGQPTRAVRKSPEFQSVLREIAQSLDEPLSFDIVRRRYLRIYADDTFYVVKPSQRRFWTRSAGLVDGDSVMKDYLEHGAV